LPFHQLRRRNLWQLRPKCQALARADWLEAQQAELLEVPRPGNASAGAGSEPMYLLVDSTGLKLCGKGEWLLEKHGTATRRSWRMLHLGVDAETGRIVASMLTPKDVDDASQAGPLLDQVAGAVASFTGDGAYDQDRVYDSVAERHPDAAVVVPPRATAVPSEMAESTPTQRDGHLQRIAEHGRMAWQSASGYNRRARVEAAMNRWKQVIGDELRAHTDERRAEAVKVPPAKPVEYGWRGPRWRSPSTRSTACWISDAQATSASPDPRRDWGQCARTPDPCTTLAFPLGTGLPCMSRYWPKSWRSAWRTLAAGKSHAGSSAR